MKTLIQSVIVWLCLLWISPASAHTALLGSTPNSGSTLVDSPAVIELEFREAARLTSAVLIDGSGNKRKLEFAVGGGPNVYRLLEPKLVTGRNEIQWKALSKDGHVVSGSLVLTLKPTP